MIVIACLALGVALGLSLVATDDPPDDASKRPATPAGRDDVKPPRTEQTDGPVQKDVIVGFLDRNGPPPPGYPVSGYVVQVPWADLQPKADGPIAENNAVDRAIAHVRSAAQDENKLMLKLRVYAGIQAPDWAKQIDGPPIPVQDPISGRKGTVGRFWGPEFGRAYARLQELLAAKYDDVAEVREVVISRCTTVFAEPFQRQLGEPAVVSALREAGLNDENDRSCHREQIEAHQVWNKTPSDLALNPYQSVTAGKQDLSFTVDLMQYCRQQLGTRCVLENNSLKSEPPGDTRALYEKMRSLGPPLTFQTAPARKVGDLIAAVTLAADLGAASVELPIAYRSQPAPALSEALTVQLRRLREAG